MDRDAAQPLSGTKNIVENRQVDHGETREGCDSGPENMRAGNRDGARIADDQAELRQPLAIDQYLKPLLAISKIDARGGAKCHDRVDRRPGNIVTIRAIEPDFVGAHIGDRLTDIVV
jgi:hypothetical protein